MTFFENELRKLLIPQYPEATFVGRAAYVHLSDMNRAKLQFVTCGTADHYEAIQMTILNRNDGQIDSLRLRFSDVWGKGQVNNPYIKQSGPYAWTYNGKTERYAYQPNSRDYQQLSNEVSKYLDLFQEQTHSASQHWAQTMQ